MLRTRGKQGRGDNGNTVKKRRVMALVCYIFLHSSLPLSFKTTPYFGVLLLKSAKEARTKDRLATISITPSFFSRGDTQPFGNLHLKDGSLHSFI